MDPVLGGDPTSDDSVPSHCIQTHRVLNHSEDTEEHYVKFSPSGLVSSSPCFIGLNTLYQLWRIELHLHLAVMLPWHAQGARWKKEREDGHPDC